MKVSTRRWLGAITVLFAWTAGAQTAYFETLDIDAQWGARELSKSQSASLDLSAFAVPMQASVQTNADLLDRIPGHVADEIRASDAIFLKGRLRDRDTSWVRLSRVAGQWSGALWDGHELYLIDDAASLRSSGFSGIPYDARTVIFRQSEARWPAARDIVIDPRSNFSVNSEELDLANWELPGGTIQKGATAGSSRVLDMTIVADTEFIAINSANPGAAVVARINVVDGVYAAQTGVSIRVAHLELLTDNGTMTSTDSSDLLGEFSSYMRSGTLPQPGLAHLFSGKNFDSNIVGVAYLGVLCSQSWGFGINEFRGSGSSGAMVLAHEMGHNFGAPHDGSGSCSEETFRGIMNPSINGSEQFSQCSLDTMADDIDRASCLEVIDYVWSNGFE